MWRKSISLVAVLIISIACGSFGNPTPAPQQNQPSQGNADSSSNSNNPSDENKIIILDNLETTPPSDIIQEIAFFGGLGGGCGFQMCVCEMTPNTSLGLFADEETVEIMNIIQFQVCGVQGNESATVTVELPDQSTEIFHIESVSFDGDFSGYMMQFEYTPTLATPPGNYHFIFSGNGWEFDQYINVLDADGPRLYSDQNTLTFYNFQPNERVRLFAYNDSKLVGWKELNVGSTGKLLLQTSIDADFIVVGDISGQVFDQEKGEYVSKWAWLGTPTDIYCNGFQSQITPMENVELLVSNPPIYNYDYGSDSFTENGNSNLKQGTILEISSNPICSGNSYYWLACLGTDCNYMPEFFNQQTYLSPTTNQASENSSNQPSDIPSCPGTLPSRLYIGAKAEVTTSGMAPQLSLRSQPSMSAEKVHVIAAGRDMVILDGPICAENSYWWYIRSEQGFEGWSREGDNEDYWIDPLP